MDWGSVFHPPPKLQGQQCKGKENWNLQQSFNTDKDIVNGFVLKALVLNSDGRDIYTPYLPKARYK